MDKKIVEMLHMGLEPLDSLLLVWLYGYAE